LGRGQAQTRFDGCMRPNVRTSSAQRQTPWFPKRHPHMSIFCNFIFISTPSRMHPQPTATLRVPSPPSHPTVQLPLLLDSTLYARRSLPFCCAHFNQYHARTRRDSTSNIQLQASCRKTAQQTERNRRCVQEFTVWSGQLSHMRCYSRNPVQASDAQHSV